MSNASLSFWPEQGLRRGLELGRLVFVVAGVFGATWVHADAQIQASASFRLDGGSTEYRDGTSSGPLPAGTVDLLEFGEAPQGLSSYGIRASGSATGHVGSQSSGQGNYDATGHIAITQTVVNATDRAQLASFNFFISPGLLNNEIRSDLSAPGSFVDAGIQFGIQRNGAQVWGSQAQLRTDAAGTVFNQSGANLYTLAGPSTYSIQGGAQSVSLGVLEVGESITVQYELSTYARGWAPEPMDPHVVSSQTVVIPEQAVYYPETSFKVLVIDHGLGSGGGCATLPNLPGVCSPQRWETVTRPAYTDVMPEWSVTTDEFVSFQPSGSHARSGDVFVIDATGRTQSLFLLNLERPLSPPASPFSITMTPVPEPSTWMLIWSGLLTVGTLAARRRLTSTNAG